MPRVKRRPRPDAAKTGSSRKYRRKKSGCEDISEQDCVDLLERQGGRCAICPKELKWPDRTTHVDHDHKTGKVRGILCVLCNSGLGRFQDSPDLLERAANYLRNGKRVLSFTVKEIA